MKSRPSRVSVRQVGLVSALGPGWLRTLWGFFRLRAQAPFPSSRGGVIHGSWLPPGGEEGLCRLFRGNLWRPRLVAGGKRKYLVAISPAPPDRCFCRPCVAALRSAPATEERFLSVRRGRPLWLRLCPLQPGSRGAPLPPVLGSRAQALAWWALTFRVVEMTVLQTVEFRARPAKCVKADLRLA